MAGRGGQTFKKRQKEQQRKERQEEKRARRFGKKFEVRGPGEEPGPPIEPFDDGLDADLVETSVSDADASREAVS